MAAAVKPIPEGFHSVSPYLVVSNTIKALERRGLISPGEGRDPLTIVWRLKGK